MDVARVKALALNAGSSSLKAALYEVEPGAALAVPGEPVWAGAVDRDPGDGGAAARALLRELPDDVDAVGHRIVHGGAHLHAPAPLTDEVKAAVRSVSELAPLHNAAGLEGVAVAEERFADVPQVAVFDTAFHSRLAPAARTYAGPHEWVERGLRRYGFHGINHEYAAQRAAYLLGRPLDELRLITCHLGSGCSLAAIRDGRSVDTTMGFTPLEGVVMGTRAGSLDPGCSCTCCARRARRSTSSTRAASRLRPARALGRLRRPARRARRAQPRRRARAARVRRLRPPPALPPRRDAGRAGRARRVVFTAGVGEHSAEVRAAALEPFAFLGVALDGERNEHPPLDCDVATTASPCAWWSRVRARSGRSRAPRPGCGSRAKRATWEDGRT